MINTRPHRRIIHGKLRLTSLPASSKAGEEGSPAGRVLIKALIGTPPLTLN